MTGQPRADDTCQFFSYPIHNDTPDGHYGPEGVPTFGFWEGHTTLGGLH